MNRRKRTIGIALLLLLVLVGPPTWITYREWKQARLDHALIAAIKAGNDQKALEAMAEGASGEAKDTGETPTFREALLHLLDHIRHPGHKDKLTGVPALILLYRAAKYDLHSGPNPTVVRALLDHGARVNDRDEHGWSSFHYACHISNSDTIVLLLARGADIESADDSGYTPLTGADAEVTKILLEHGANIEARDKDQWTPLIWAAYRTKTDVIRILLEHGANVSAKHAANLTALDYVRDIPGPESHKIAALLRQYGAK